MTRTQLAAATRSTIQYLTDEEFAASAEQQANQLARLEKIGNKSTYTRGKIRELRVLIDARKNEATALLLEEGDRDCPECDGSGDVERYGEFVPCNHCDGTGALSEKTNPVHIQLDVERQQRAARARRIRLLTLANQRGGVYCGYEQIVPYVRRQETGASLRYEREVVTNNAERNRAREKRARQTVQASRSILARPPRN